MGGGPGQRKTRGQGPQYVPQFDDFVFPTRKGACEVGTRVWNTLPVIPGAGYNAAGGVNAQEVIAGNWTTDPTISTGNQGWMFDPRTGSYSFFDVPGADKVHYVGTIVNGINNAGVVAGYFSDSNGVYHGFTKIGGQFQTIDVPGADFTILQDINDQGDLSGAYSVGGVRNGFVLTRAGKLITIDVPVVNHTVLAGISDNGNVSGYYKDADGVFHGFYVLKAVP